MDPRKQTPGGRHQIGIPAGFKSESVAGFLLECLAGFIGIRTLPFGLAEIDARLPAGGLVLRALHEVAGGGTARSTGRRFQLAAEGSRCQSASKSDQIGVH
jgi:hypothetical protein